MDYVKLILCIIYLILYVLGYNMYIFQTEYKKEAFIRALIFVSIFTILTLILKFIYEL